MSRLFSFSAAFFLLVAFEASAVTINHNNIDGVATLPQSTMNAIGQQKWFFAHASVGGNMLEGMDSLHDNNSTRYQLDVLSAGGAPPGSTSPGVVYGYDRGNPSWEGKLQDFRDAVDAGWRSPKVDFVMDKFCFIDQDAGFTAYRDSMALLSATYPGTTFVYTTMPLTTYSDSSNILRNQYNEAVRGYCLANNKLLFDIADIEAYSPTGAASTFVSGGVTYQKLYSGYASDEGHLNSTGSQRVAAGWYAAAATAVPEPGTFALLLIGGAALLVARIARKGR
jgi:hypothetical protein